MGTYQATRPIGRPGNPQERPQTPRMDRQRNPAIRQAYRSINGLATSKQCPKVASCGTADGPGQEQSLRMSPAGPTPATLPWLSVHSGRYPVGRWSSGPIPTLHMKNPRAES